MQERIIAEVLHDHKNIVTDEGDVRSRGDFDAEAYPDIPPRVVEAHGILNAISFYKQSEELKHQRMGVKPNTKLSRSLAGQYHDSLLEARLTYLRAVNIHQHEAPEGVNMPDYDEKYDAYLEGVLVWGEFREGVLKQPEIRAALELDLTQKIEQFNESLYL